MMQAFDTVSIDDLVALPPTIFGTIRWKKYIGRPPGDLCSGFNIRVEEHTATQFRAVGGGKYEPIPGTGIWKDVVDSVSCWDLPDEGDLTSSVSNLGARHPSECFSRWAVSNHADSKRHVEPGQSGCDCISWLSYDRAKERVCRAQEG